ncbi:MAG: lytic transglycosylase domain-containing protein [Firmicutes bacterium]|nr:lytic transglycosylase domain-containing protein [Bacillota bacterium]
MSRRLGVPGPRALAERWPWLPFWLRLAALLVVVGAGLWLLGLFAYPFPYRDEVFQAAARYGVSPYLVAAVIRQESHWQPGVVSRQGARGLMQVMPETGRWAATQMGLGPLDPDRLFDPAVNIEVGTWYLGFLMQKFDGNWAAALAAYNGGSRHVEEWLRQGRWTGGADRLHEIPFPETRTFVRRVLRDYRRYRLLYGDWLRGMWARPSR